MIVPLPHPTPALIGNLDLTEVLVIALFAVMIFGRNLPRVAAQAVAHVTRARKALQGVWRDSGISEEIRQVQRELEQNADALRKAAPRHAAGNLVRELESETMKPATAPADAGTEDEDAEVAGHETEPGGSDQPAGERDRVPSWYPQTLQPPSSQDFESTEGLPKGPGVSPGGLGAPLDEDDVSSGPDPEATPYEAPEAEGPRDGASS